MLQKSIPMKFAAFILSLIILLQTGCKKNDGLAIDPPPLEPPVITNDMIKVTATVTGSVIDENNQPVPNAIVKADAYYASTDAMGNFVFRNINISKANGHVTVIKQGYFNGTRSFVTETGKNNYVKIQLIKKIITGTVSGATGGVISTPTGAAINFPANVFVTENGAAYTGNVTVYAHWIDPTAANLPLVVPGDLRGIDSTNGEYLLKSYGMVGADLEDNNGNILRLAYGKKATVSFPIPSSLQGTAPASIPLWHFDEHTGRWGMEGSATKSGNSYVGQVNKFSFWNVDVRANFVNLDFTLVNSANNFPLANTLIKITSLATNTYAFDYTNDSGYLSMLVPKNENLKLEVIAGILCSGNPVMYTKNIGPYTNNSSLGNFSITPSNLIIHFTGSIKKCNGQPVTNGYVSIGLVNGNSTIALANAAGTVDFSLIHCGGSMAYSFNAVDLSTGSYSAAVTGTAASATVNLGFVTACGNNINLNGVYIAGFIGTNAVLWEEGVPRILTNNSVFATPGAMAYRTLVANNNVYALVNDQNVIKIWKDGVMTNVTSAPSSNQAYGFDVYNNDVYVCGAALDSVPLSAAVIWKNGTASVLPKDTFEHVMAHAVKVINGDVYVAGEGSRWASGSMRSVFKAVYWKNGVLNVLTGQGNKGYAYSLFSVNSDVYICGSDGVNLPMENTVYWKNGVKTTLAITGNHTRAVGRSIFVDNNNIYIAGSTGYSNSANYYYDNAAYWKNSTVNLLTNFSNPYEEAYLNEVFVKNNIIYTVGQSYSNVLTQTPLYFQNGIAVPLAGNPTNLRAGAYGVFVK